MSVVFHCLASRLLGFRSRLHAPSFIFADLGLPACGLLLAWVWLLCLLFVFSALLLCSFAYCPGSLALVVGSLLSFLVLWLPCSRLRRLFVAYLIHLSSVSMICIFRNTTSAVVLMSLLACVRAAAHHAFLCACVLAAVIARVSLQFAYHYCRCKNVPVVGDEE